MNDPEQNPKMEQKCPQCGATVSPGALGGLCPACLLKQAATAETATQGETIPFEPPKLEELATLFPNLEILELIGKGGMGAVYKARQTALDRLIALKILPPQIAAGPGFSERFSREARALAKLNHPNIIGLYEFGQVGGLAYFMMEYVDGLNLRQVQRAGKLSPREALQIVPQICEALQFAHDEGVVHRDIKPENILIDKKGRVKIADFGIAKIMGREAQLNLTETRMAIGTPQYMAPEQLEKPQTVDHRADIFSLGVVFYEMLTGELPLGRFAPPSTASRKVHVDVRLDDVVLRALEKEPERRYQQASQVKSAVETISTTQPSASAIPADAEALRATLSTRDYVLHIGHCLARAWALLKTDFWPIVGINTLIVILLWAVGAFPLSFGAHGAVPGSSLLSMLFYGPLMGGLYYSYLKRIRGEKVSVETAFSGFSHRFVQLLLGSLVGFCLVGLGFLCLILPGIYFLVCWAYSIPLIIDKGIDFWPAMGISRQMVRKHWWKNFALVLVLSILHVAGLLVFGFGIFFTAPIAAAALMYAYQDIFSDEPATASDAGPAGTQVIPPSPFGSPLKPVLIGGTAIVIMLAFLALFTVGRREPRRAHAQRAVAHERATQADNAARAERQSAVETEVTEKGFGPVQERLVTNGINFKTGKLISLPDPAENSNSSIDELLLTNLRKAELMGIDAFITSESTGLYASMGTSFARLANADWDSAQAAEIEAAISTANTNEIPTVVMQMGTNEPATYAFSTRELVAGVLQIVGTNAEPFGLKVRYKLAEDGKARAAPAANTRVRLRDRLNAGRMITDMDQRGKALSVVAADAAQAGQLDICRDALNGIADRDVKNETTAVAARALAARGMPSQAIELARRISDLTQRDRTLADLAR